MRLKLTLYIFLVILSSFNVAFSQRQEFILDGEIGIPFGKVCLAQVKYAELDERQILSCDFSSTVDQDNFQIKGFLEYPTAFNLLVYVRDSIIYQSDFFIIESGYQTAFFDIKKPTNTPIVQNNEMKYIASIDSFKNYNRIKKDTEWFRSFADSINCLPVGSANLDSLLNVIQGINYSLVERRRGYIHNICFAETDSFYALWLLYIDFKMNGIKPGYEYFFTHFSDRLKRTTIGEIFNSELNRENPVGTGKSFPTSNVFKNLKTNNFEKFVINPSSNYTLIDLWHSSCGNCIKELIDYKEIYSIYSEKGFEIISITGDRPDMLNYLSKLREKYEFPWPEYLDESRKIMESEFSVAIFPTNFLLDNEGRIIGKNLSPTELESFLHENL